jgi:hypothetical protein
MGYKETAAINRQVSSKEWIEKSRAADYAANGNAAKSTAQYTATVEVEEKARQEKGVFLEFRNGVYSEPLCGYTAISNLIEGQHLWFSIQDINRLILAIEMEITWQDEEKDVYRLADDDKKTRLFFIRKVAQYLQIGLIE